MMRVRPSAFIPAVIGCVVAEIAATYEVPGSLSSRAVVVDCVVD